MHLLQSPKNVSSVLLILLTLFLLGTITVLGTVWKYFHVDASAVILVEELELRVPWSAEAAARRAVVESGSARIERRAGARMGVEARDEAGEVVPAFKSKYPHLASWVYSLIGSSDAGNGDAVQQGKVEEKVKPLSSEGLAGVGAGAGLKIAVTTPTTSLGGNASGNATRRIAGEKIPRIIHQTWKTDTLPEKWAKVRAECQVLHPDYEYMLWTDADSRAFIAEHYPWFTETFDSYPYAIQRADAIRYFVLYHYGGVYMDLDIGCYKPLDPLLRFEVILPETIPVGVSNDLMFAAPRHPFMEEVVRNLIPFDHHYFSHYPTVMFSTGPMFLSASYRIWLDAHPLAQPSTPQEPARGLVGVRILPKILYGKNLPPEQEREHAFFKHFYGSSWHAGDADFIIFLRKSGKWLFILGTCIASLGLLKKLGFVLAPASVLRHIAPLWRWTSALSLPWNSSSSAQHKHSHSHRLLGSSSRSGGSSRSSIGSSAAGIDGADAAASASHSRRPSAEQLLPRYQAQPSQQRGAFSALSGFGRGGASLDPRNWWSSSSAAPSRQRPSWSAATPVTSAFADEKSNFALLPRQESSKSIGSTFSPLIFSTSVDVDDEGAGGLGGFGGVQMDCDGGASSSRMTLASSSSSSQQQQQELWGAPQTSSQRIVSWQQAAAASNSNSNSNGVGSGSGSGITSGSSSDVLPLHQQHSRYLQGSSLGVAGQETNYPTWRSPTQPPLTPEEELQYDHTRRTGPFL